MNIGILLWNTCNAKCDHCSVSSSPTEISFMSDEQIFHLIDESFYDDENPKIGLSGGEAFLYFDRLVNIVQYACKKGASVSVNTNGFWGTTLAIAKSKIEKIQQAGLCNLVVSLDEFHEEYIPRTHVLNVIRACQEANLNVSLQYVATKSSQRLADLLDQESETLQNVSTREIPCFPVGRAALNVPETDLFTRSGIPTGKCPAPILTVSAYGEVLPCCNAAGHLPSLHLGTINEPLSHCHYRFKNDPVIALLTKEGPAAFLHHAEQFQYHHPETGYLDECHLCYELFKDQQRATQLRNFASEKRFKQVFEEYTQKYTQQCTASS